MNAQTLETLTRLIFQVSSNAASHARNEQIDLVAASLRVIEKMIQVTRSPDSLALQDLALASLTASSSTRAYVAEFINAATEGR